MPAPRLLALAAIVLVMIGGCRGGASGPKVTLRYHPPAGAAYHYALDQQNAMRIEGGPMSAMPEQTFRMKMYYTQLVKLDRRVRPNLVKDVIADRREEDVRRALAHTRQTRPQDAFAHFKKQLGGRVTAGPAAARERVPPLNPISDEPY